MLDQKSRRIQELKSLLSQTRRKLQLYKQQLQMKDDTILQLQTTITSLKQSQQSKQPLISAPITSNNNLSEEYQQTKKQMKRIEGVVLEKEKLNESLQKQNQILSAANKNMSVSIQVITNILNSFTKSFELIEQQNPQSQPITLNLPEICSQLTSSLTLDPSISQLKSSLALLLHQAHLLLTHTQHQSLLSSQHLISSQTTLSHLSNQLKLKDESITLFQQQINNKTLEYQKQTEIIKREYTSKLSKEELNIEYLKNVFLKLFDAVDEPCVRMSLKVIQSLLFLTDAEMKVVEKHWKI